MKKDYKIVYATLSYSYIYLVDNILSLYEVPSPICISDIDTEFDEISKEMCNIFTSLPTLIGADETYTLPFINRITDLRNKIENKYRALINYRKELAYTTFTRNFDDKILDDSQISIEQFDEIDFNQIALDCTEHVFSNPDLTQSVAADVLSVTPIKMTQDYFFYYVKKSLAYVNLADDPEVVKEFIKNISNHLIKQETYELKEIENILKDIQAIEDIDEFLEECEYLEETIEYLIFACNALFKISGMYFNLLLLDSITFADIKNLYVSYNDFFHTLKHIIAGEYDEYLLSTFRNQVNMASISVMEKYVPMAKQHIDLEHINFMKFNLLVGIEEMFSYGRVEEPTERSRECAIIIENFLEEAAKSLKSMPKREAKIRMQFFISSIPFIMSKNQFYEYVIDGLGNTNIPNKPTLVTAIQLVSLLDEQEDYSDFDDEYSEDFEDYIY
ncbi:MAG: hypothetical protein ATN33_02960 [Epulopiscium sp. Nele67-Bin001]|nr:MAG: hypothetical protein ATN33_02960 [Epulopiscium sp. Nele67-Bin001]